MYRPTLLLGLTVLAAALTSACTPPLTSAVRGTSLGIGDDATRLGLPRSHPDRLLPLPARDRVATRPLPRWAEAPPLSPGDRLQVDVDDGDGFSGRYEIDMSGALILPHLPTLMVAGKDTRHAEARIRTALVEADFFKPHRARVSVRVHEWAHVQVHVSGAVFDPGMVSINVRTPEERALKSDLASGDFPSERMLAAALRAAGGIRPDAAVDTIQLIREGEALSVDYAGLIRGHDVPAVPLMSGDTIVVPSAGRFDPVLVAPSAITPPGIRVFLSNLTLPATGNAVSAVGRQATSLPYGSRLLTAAFSANCVGGVSSTSAARHAVLVRSDPITGRGETLERAIHDLLQAPHRDDLNPFLMPNDSISCYDSGVTNLRDIARTLADILLPFSLL